MLLCNEILIIFLIKKKNFGQELPVFVQGKLAICNYCGFSSPTFNQCLRCKRKLPPEVKSTTFSGNKSEKNVSILPLQSVDKNILLQQSIDKNLLQQQNVKNTVMTLLYYFYFLVIIIFLNFELFQLFN